MIYNYLEFTAAIRRPIIEIIVKSENNFAIYPVLIDSGADYCIFNMELAKALGIKLTKKRINFRGVGKDKVKGFWGQAGIKIGSYSYQIKAIFADINQFGHGILGQQGFFDHFDVKLSYHKGIIDIKPIETSN